MEVGVGMHIIRILFVGLFPQVILLTSFWELIKEIREDKARKGDAEAGDLAVKILGIVIILAFEAIVLWRCIPIVIESVQGLLPK